MRDSGSENDSQKRQRSRGKEDGRCVWNGKRSVQRRRVDKEKEHDTRSVVYEGGRRAVYRGGVLTLRQADVMRRWELR